MGTAAVSTGPPVKVYRLYLPGLFKLLMFGMLVSFTLLGFLMVLGVFQESPPRPFAVFWLAVFGALWFRALTIPHRIEVLADGRVAFVSILRRIRIFPLEVESIRPASSQLGFFVLRHRGGKILFIGQFDGFHEFLSDLKLSNPRIELRGC